LPGSIAGGAAWRALTLAAAWEQAARNARVGATLGHATAVAAAAAGPKGAITAQQHLQHHLGIFTPLLKGLGDCRAANGVATA
jgi:hypothetical protein